MRDRRSRSGAHDPATIHVSRGEYLLDKPLQLHSEDSAITIEGTGRDTVLLGGIRISGWTRDGDRFQAAPVDGVREGTVDFRQLFVNGTPRSRARLPDNGRMEHESRFDQPWLGTNFGQFTPPPSLEQRTSLRYAEGQLPASFSVNNAEFTFYHSWDDSKSKAISHDPSTRTVRLYPPCTYPPGAFGNRTYSVANLREGMLKPGQWYLDRDQGAVVYWPFPGEQVNDLCVEAGVLPQIIAVRGTASHPVRDTCIRSLRIRLAAADLVSTGFGGAVVPGALEMTHCEGALIQDVHIDCVSGQGIRIHGNRTRVADCSVTTIGTCGIVVTGEGNEIDGNTTRDTGLLYPSSPGINASGLNLKIVNNDVSHSSYSGIIASAGRSAELGDPIDGNLLVEGNHISHVMKVLDDGGCIYSVGRGNTIRRNRCHNAIGHSVGIYVDEVSENYLIEDNIVYAAGMFVLENHACDRMTIRNNVFHAGPGVGFAFPRSKTITFEDNTIVTTEPPTDWYLPEQLQTARNIVWPCVRDFGYPRPLHYGMLPVPRAAGPAQGRLDTITVNPDAAESSWERPEGSRDLGPVPYISVQGSCPTDTDWEHALRLPDLVETERQDRTPPAPLTDSRVLRDEEALYFRILCFGESCARPSTKDFWQSSRIEIYLGPDPGRAARLLLATNIHGDSFGYLLPKFGDLGALAEWTPLRSLQSGWGMVCRVPCRDVVDLVGGEAREWTIYVSRSSERPSIDALYNTGTDAPAFVFKDPGLADVGAHNYCRTGTRLRHGS